MIEVSVRHMLADKGKMKNAIAGFSSEFHEHKIIGCEILIDRKNPSLMITKIVGEEQEKTMKFLGSPSFRKHLHNNLKNRFEIVF